jgi:hypothetical protein
MPNECGIVVEGSYDSLFYKVIIKRVCPEITCVLSREAGGKATFMHRLAGFLHSLEHISQTGGPVRKAIAIRDTDGKDPAVVETDMQNRIYGQRYSFPCGAVCHATHQEMEAWLLADIEAINRTARRLLGTPRSMARRPANSIEDIIDAKERLQEILSLVGLLYDPETCAFIAQEIDFAILRASCPSFRRFEQRVCIA